MMTPKQVLRSHIVGMHRRHPAQSWTMAQMAEWHARQHHRFHVDHFHEGENRGPGTRPPGWRTGEGAVPRG